MLCEYLVIVGSCLARFRTFEHGEASLPLCILGARVQPTGGCNPLEGARHLGVREVREVPLVPLEILRTIL